MNSTEARDEEDGMLQPFKEWMSNKTMDYKTADSMCSIQSKKYQGSENMECIVYNL